MKSKRLLEIAKLIEKDDIVLDVGCDHGYLCIYLKKNNICKDVIACDISKNALNSAINNFKKNNLEIKSYVSDGFTNVSDNFNTAVIAGMGTSTILNILNNNKRPDKLIISSHNELYRLRKSLNNLGYKIIKEIIIEENNHYYSIIKCIKGRKKLSSRYLKYGISNNYNYFNYLYNKNRTLLKRVPILKKIKLLFENHTLKKLLKESRSI